MANQQQRRTLSRREREARPEPTPREHAINALVRHFDTARQQRGVTHAEAGELLDTFVVYLQSIGVETPGLKPRAALGPGRGRDDEEEEDEGGNAP
jgi:hypothetical protein